MPHGPERRAEIVENNGMMAVMFVAGDEETGKQAVLQLVGDIGFEALDAGPLRNARLLEPFAMVWIDQAFNRGRGRDFALTIDHARE